MLAQLLVEQEHASNWPKFGRVGIDELKQLALKATVHFTDLEGCCPLKEGISVWFTLELLSVDASALQDSSTELNTGLGQLMGCL